MYIGPTWRLILRGEDCTPKIIGTLIQIISKLACTLERWEWVETHVLRLLVRTKSILCLILEISSKLLPELRWCWLRGALGKALHGLVTSKNVTSLLAWHIIWPWIVWWFHVNADLLFICSLRLPWCSTKLINITIRS